VVNINKIIRNFEPLMFKLLRKFRIPKRFWDDYLQELRIVSWHVLEKYDKKKGSLTTIMQISMENRIKDLLRKADNETVFLEDLPYHKKAKALKVKADFISEIDTDFIKDKLTNLEKRLVKLYLKGWTQTKMGKHFNVTQSAIQQRLQMLFKKLKQAIKRR